LDVYDVKLIGLQQCTYSNDFHEKRHFIFIDFVCRTDKTEVVLNREHQEYVWIEIDKIETLMLEPFTRKLLNEYKTGKRSKYLKDVLYNYYL